MLSLSGGYHRMFTELSRQLAELLAQLYPSGSGDPFMDRLLESIPAKPDRADSSLPPKIHPGISQPSALPSPLSTREMEVLQLLSAHLRDKEIAAKLHISPATVRRHCTNIYRKIEVHNRRKAVARAQDLGLL